MNEQYSRYFPAPESDSSHSLVSEGGVYKRLTYGMMSRENYQWVWPSEPIPAFLPSPFCAAIGHLPSDFLFQPANVSRSTISCSLRAFVALLCLCPLAPWELRLTMHSRISGTVRFSFQQLLLCTYNKMSSPYKIPPLC